VEHLYPQARGSLFVAFYDSRGYGGGILTRLHTEKLRVAVLNFHFMLLTYFLYFEKKIKLGLCDHLAVLHLFVAPPKKPQ
jgi:hypothetical protein